MKAVDKLKTLQADSLAFYVKVHNYHWNVKGMQFFPVHEMTEEIYTKFATVYDDCAERVLQLGQKPHLSMGEVIIATNIREEDGNDFDARYVLESIKKDYEYFLKGFKELSSLAEADGDSVTVAYADEKTAELEKDIWMLTQSLK